MLLIEMIISFFEKEKPKTNVEKKSSPYRKFARAEKIQEIKSRWRGLRQKIMANARDIIEPVMSGGTICGIVLGAGYYIYDYNLKVEIAREDSAVYKDKIVQLENRLKGYEETYERDMKKAKTENINSRHDINLCVDDVCGLCVFPRER